MAAGKDTHPQGKGEAQPDWVPHPIFGEYELHPSGKIRSVDRYVQTRNRWGPCVRFAKGRELALFPKRDGYLGSNICVDGKRMNFELHVMMCETFHGPCRPRGWQVRHLNGNNLDNSPSNLRWGSASENAVDKVNHGRHPQARKTHCVNMHELTEDNVYHHPAHPMRRKCRTCSKAADVRRRSRKVR